MKAWEFDIQSTPDEVSKKLKSALNSGVFVFSTQQKNETIAFKFRKRILYIWYMYDHNWTNVNGKILKAGAEDKTRVEISFSQHAFILMIIGVYLLLGLGFLVALLMGIKNGPSFYIPGAILLALGIVLWIRTQKKFSKDIQNYKTLISEILGL